MSKLHEELKELRLNHGVTLTNIFDRTKIRIEILERLEKGEYDVAPRPYVRAFLREYAESIGVDPQKVMDVMDNKRASIIDVTTLPPVKSPENAPKISIPEIEATPEIAAAVPVTAEVLPEEARVDEPAAEPAFEETLLEMLPIIAAPEEPSVESIEQTPVEENAVASESVPASIEPSKKKRSRKTSAESNVEPITATEQAESPAAPEPKGDTANAAGDDTDTTVTARHKQEENQEQTATSLSQPSLFEGQSPDPVRKKVVPVISDDTLPDEPASPETSKPAPRKRLEIEEPESGSKVFLIVFIILIIAAAAAIVWMNRSGMF